MSIYSSLFVTKNRLYGSKVFLHQHSEELPRKISIAYVCSSTRWCVITLESPVNASNVASEANVAAKGMMPPVISFAKQAMSGSQSSISAAVCNNFLNHLHKCKLKSKNMQNKFANWPLFQGARILWRPHQISREFFEFCIQWQVCADTMDQSFASHRHPVSL